MNGRYWASYGVTAVLLMSLACAAESRPILLRCPSDSGTPKGLDYVIDPEAKTFSTPAVPGTLPLQQNDTHYFARVEEAGALLLDVRIDRSTLRYTFFSAFPQKTTVTGQCRIEGRKI